MMFFIWNIEASTTLVKTVFSYNLRKSPVMIPIIITIINFISIAPLKTIVTRCFTHCNIKRVTYTEHNINQA